MQHAAGPLRVAPLSCQELEYSLLHTQADFDDLVLVAVALVVEDETIDDEDLHDGDDVPKR